MRTIWVFNDFGKGVNQRDVLMLLASAKLWSIHCPNDYRVLYCSNNLGDTLVSLGMLKLFNEAILLPNSSRFLVDTRVFWASPKLEVLLQQREPVRIIDHDFLALCPIPDFIPENSTCYCYTEDARNYYPSKLNENVRALTYKARWPDESANVSFLQLPFPDWTEFYAGTSLQIMEEFTKMKVPDARYLIFAEQMVFKHLLSSLETPVSCLIKNIYECKTESWTENTVKEGIWTLEEAWDKKFIHYGPTKSRWGITEYRTKMEEICNISELPLTLIKRTDYLRR